MHSKHPKTKGPLWGAVLNTLLESYPLRSLRRNKKVSYFEYSKPETAPQEFVSQGVGFSA